MKKFFDVCERLWQLGAGITAFGVFCGSTMVDSLLDLQISIGICLVGLVLFIPAGLTSLILQWKYRGIGIQSEEKWVEHDRAD